MAGALASLPAANGVPRGIPLPVMSAGEMRRKEDLEAQEAEALKIQQTAPVTKLGEHVKACYDAANEHHRKYIDDRLTCCDRYRRGEYDPEVLAQIKEMGGSDLYFNVTDPKVTGAVAWIVDVLLPTQQKAWALEPTPLPDLPEGKRGQVAEMAVNGVRYAEMMAGQPMPEEQVREVLFRMYDAVLAMEQAEAVDRADRMERIMEDQLVEGGFMEALSEFIDDFCTYPTAIIKGPVVRPVRRMAWENGELIDRMEFIPSWSCVSPSKFKPAPNVRTLAEGYICEDIEIDVRELQNLRDLPGYQADAIDGVLQDLARGDHGPDLSFATPGHLARADLENKDYTVAGGSSPTTVRGTEYWGPAQGSMLQEWGLPVEDAGTWYEIQCIQIGRWVIKAMLNPDKLGRRPYSACSFRRINRSVWGQALVELMEDCQRMANGAGRALVNNMALASGPLGAADIDALAEGEDPEDIQPWRIFQYHGSLSGARQPVTWHQVPAMMGPLLEILEFVEDKAADRTNVPRYTHGQEEIGGAGQTARGLSMLMGAATKGLRQIITRLDSQILRPSLQRLYTWNLMYHEDDAAKGDCRIVPRGVLKVLMRDEQQMRRQQVLADSLNPVDQMIIGPAGRTELWRAVLDDYDLPTDKIITVPDGMDPMAMMMQQQGPPTGGPGGPGQQQGPGPEPTAPTRSGEMQQ